MNTSHSQALPTLIKTILQHKQNQALFYAINQIRRTAIAKQLKSIPKCNDLTLDQSMLSARGNQRGYQTIKPLENNYSSIQIIENLGFDMGAQMNSIKGILQELQQEPVFEKKDYIQKYLNQTKKPILLVEQFPLSIYATKSIQQYNAVAMNKIKQNDYQKFLQQVLVKKTFLGKPLNRMQYKFTSIHSALTCMEQKYEQTAVNIFQKILKFDSPVSHKNRFCYAAQLVNYCIKMGEQLVIELYVQLLKQLNGPRFDVYLLLCYVVCATIKVPLRMYVPLLNYCVANLDQAKKQFTYMFYLLVRNFDKPRKLGITDFQAQMIMYMRQIPVTMDMPTQKTFFMQTNATVQDLIQTIVSFFQLDRNIEYVIHFNQNCYTTGKLFDCFYYSIFQVGDTTIQTNEQIYQKFNGFKVVLTFKNMMDALSSKPNRDLLYIFECRKYLQGAFSLTRQEVFMLAAYKYYSQNDALDITDIFQYVPSFLVKQCGQRSLRRQIVKKFNAIKCTKSQARKKFLKIISQKDVFMALTFYSKLYFDDDDEIVIDVVLFLKPGYLTLIGFRDYPLYKTYQIQSIIEWGKTQSQICLRISKFGFIHLQCNNQQVVAEVFQGYLKSLSLFVVENGPAVKKQLERSPNKK